MRCHALLLALSTPFLGGCASGRIFTYTTEPLTTNLHETPYVSTGNSGDVKRFDYYVSVEWDENGIGEIARKHGFEEVYYADLETLSVLGIWTQRRVHAYGRRAASPPASADTAADPSGE